jgi:hypothetical protein
MDGNEPFSASNSRPRLRRAITVPLVLIFLAMAGVVLFWTGRHTAPDARPDSRRTAPFRASRIAAARPPAEPVPGLPQVPRVDLAGLGWSDFYGVELPVSPADGPRHVREGRAWGFADTPLGALLAAVNIGVRANAQWGPTIFGPTIRDQMVSGPGASALLAGCEANYSQESQAAGATAGQPLGRGYVTEEAFRWEAYTSADATVDIVSAGHGGEGVTVRAVTRIEVQWSGTDWQVIAPPGGDWGNSAAPLTSLSGYTMLPVPTG